MRPREALPKHPYRDSAVFYAVLAALVVIVAWATGGRILRALAFGAGFFLVATVWSWWRFHRRIEAERLNARRAAARGSGGGDS